MRSTIALVGLLAAGAVASSAGISHKDHTDRVVRKRTTETVQLYAYGTNISGLPIYAGADNLAYVATDDTAATVTNLTAVTWTIDTTGADAWTVAANTTSTNTTNATSTLTSGSSFYIVTSSDSSGSFEQAGFVSDASDAPTSAMTTGFVTYGAYVMVIGENSDNQETYVSEFWAKRSGTVGLWMLMWNVAGTAQDDSVPVTIKTTAPVALTTKNKE